MPAITKAWSSFAERDEGVAELRQRFLESPEFKQFIAENEVMKKFSPSTYTSLCAIIVIYVILT